MAIRSTTLTIGKMMCAACSARIEKRLSKLAGIKSIAVNLTTERARIEYDATVTTRDTICQAIEKMGFTASPIRPDAHTAPPQTSDAKRRLLFAALFSLPMAINMLIEFFVGHGNVPFLGNPYVQLALATPSSSSAVHTSTAMRMPPCVPEERT